MEFDLERVMRTDYDYSNLQHNYFVIDDYETLMHDTRPKAIDEQYKVILEDPFDYGYFDSTDRDKVIPPNEAIKHFY